MNFRNLKISIKLPLLIVGIAVLSIAATGIVTLYRAQNDFIKSAEEKLIALQASRENALASYLGTIEQDLSSLSRNEYVRQALLDFGNGWRELGFLGNQTKFLHSVYIVNNPNPTGSKV